MIPTTVNSGRPGPQPEHLRHVLELRRAGHGDVPPASETVTLAQYQAALGEPVTTPTTAPTGGPTGASSPGSG